MLAVPRLYVDEMSRSLLIALTLTCALPAHAELGYFVAPGTVIADHQEFWAGLELDNCKPKTMVVQTDKYFCDILWEALPSGISSDATETLLGAPKMTEGSHVIRGRIVKFRVSDPTAPVAEQEIVHNVRAIQFEPDIQLRGLPLDPLKDNDVWLESGEDAVTKCIFYGGLEVATPPAKIEDGKVYCRINWENIPPGFNQFREANTNLLTGKLLNAETKQTLDTNFIFTIEVVVPYDRQITSKRYSIDASVDVLDSPTLEWSGGQQDAFFLIDGHEQLDINPPLTVSNEHGEPMLLRLVTSEGAVLSERHLMPVLNEKLQVASMPLATLDALNLGELTDAVFELAYPVLTAKPATRNVQIIRTSPPPKVSLSSVARIDGVLKIDYELDSYGSTETYQAFLVELEEGDLSKNRLPIRSDLLAGESVGGLGSVVVSSQPRGVISVGIGGLQHSRYAIKVVQLGMDGDNVISLGHSLSQPLVISRRGVEALPGSVSDHVAPVGSWAVVADSESSTWVLAGKRLAPTHHPIHLSEAGEYAVVGEGGQMLPVRVYKNPSVRLIVPEEIRLGSTLAARVLIDGAEARLSEYEINWYEDDSYWGESSAYPLDYGDLGQKRIKVAVSSRNNPDSFYLKSTTKEATFYVRQDENEE